MKESRMVNLFYKDFGRRPKMTEVDEAIQNGSLLANQGRSRAYCWHLRKAFGKP